jgi:hypothetical protein
LQRIYNLKYFQLTKDENVFLLKRASSSEVANDLELSYSLVVKYNFEFLVSLTSSSKRYRYPAAIISQAIWLYHRFNHSYRDILKDIIKKRERKPTDKWHLDEMTLKINDEFFMLL